MKYEFDHNAPIIVVEPELEGENINQIIRMALDTGATFTMIPWKIAGALGLKPELSERRIDITTASGVESTPLVSLKSITLWDKRIENVEVIIHDLPARSYIDGLLGLNILRNFKFRIDFKKEILDVE